MTTTGFDVSLLFMEIPRFKNLKILLRLFVILMTIDQEIASILKGTKKSPQGTHTHIPRAILFLNSLFKFLAICIFLSPSLLASQATSQSEFSYEFFIARLRRHTDSLPGQTHGENVNVRAVCVCVCSSGKIRAMGAGRKEGIIIALSTA
jgi:hypothetical protein